MQTLFKVLSVSFVLIGLGCLLGEATIVGLGLCAIGMAGIGVAAYAPEILRDRGQPRSPVQEAQLQMFAVLLAACVAVDVYIAINGPAKKPRASPVGILSASSSTLSGRISDDLESRAAEGDADSSSSSAR
jgi:hypothetical protein